MGFDAPTPIQAQALPVVLAGRDIIGLAKTGSGKTFSFLWPMLTHIADQPHMQTGDGPIALILTPTRELAEQIYRHAKKFGKVFNIRACAVFGGEGKWQMVKALKEAPEIVVATPGRMIDMLLSGTTNMQRCTMAVIDECDRMFELGFEYQVKSILQHIRPDRQTLMFSATMKKRVEGFAREAVRNPVRIEVGSTDESNPDIKQEIIVLPEQGHKWPWLMCRLQACIDKGLVLIFVNSKADTEEVAGKLQQHLRDQHQHMIPGNGSAIVEVNCLHGGKQQGERSEIIRRFKSGLCKVLVATDVASRGLDIKNIRTVINYDGAKNPESHVHRIGRTGRMGLEGVVPGVAYTLLVGKKGTPSAGNDAPSFAYTDATLAVDLVQMLRKQEAAQGSGASSITPELLELAKTDPRWRKSQQVHQYQSHGGKGGSKGPGRGSGGRGAGLGHGQQAMTSAQLSAGSGGFEMKSSNVGAMQAMKKLMGGSSSSLSDNVGGNGVVNDYIPIQFTPEQQQQMQSNPYIEGRGRGRGSHMTQPAWAANTTNDAVVTESIPVHSTSNAANLKTSEENVSQTETVPRKRKNRFSTLFRGDVNVNVEATTPNLPPSHLNPPAETHHPLPPLYHPHDYQQQPTTTSSTPILNGFVRAVAAPPSSFSDPSRARAPVTHHNSGAESCSNNDRISKKSRWG